MCSPVDVVLQAHTLPVMLWAIYVFTEFACQCTYSPTHPEASFLCSVEIALQCTYSHRWAHPVTPLRLLMSFLKHIYTVAYPGSSFARPSALSMLAPFLKHIPIGIRIRPLSSNACKDLCSRPPLSDLHSCPTLWQLVQSGHESILRCHALCRIQLDLVSIDL